MRAEAFFLAVPHGLRDLSSPTKDQTQAPCSGSMESQPLDHQGSPRAEALICIASRVSRENADVLPHRPSDDGVRSNAHP